MGEKHAFADLSYTLRHPTKEVSGRAADAGGWRHMTDRPGVIGRTGLSCANQRFYVKQDASACGGNPAKGQIRIHLLSVIISRSSSEPSGETQESGIDWGLGWSSYKAARFLSNLLPY